MKKKLAVLLAGLMAVSMAACGNTSDTASTPTDTSTDTATESTSDSGSTGGVTIQVTTTYAGEDSNAQNYKDAVAAWEAKTGNKVEDSSATSDETFKSRVITDFEAGSEPDVLFYFDGVDSNQFVEQGKVVSIDEIRQTYPDYASNMKDDMLPESPADGVKYAVPVNGYWEGMFVNKAVCQAAGVEVPDANTTWDEFLEDCQKIKDAGYTPIAASLQEVPHYWFEYTIYNHQDAKTHATVPGSTDDEYGQAWVAGLNDIKGLYEKGYFPENTLTAKDAETFELFTGGKAAFLVDGSWKVGGIESAVDNIDDFTVTHVPGEGNRKTTDEIGGLSMGYYITRKGYDDAEKQAALVDFVSYMTSDEVVSKFAGTSVTALKNGAEPDMTGATSLAQAALEYSNSITAVSPAVQDNLSEAARAPIFGDMASIVQGTVTPEDAVTEVLTLASE